MAENNKKITLSPFESVFYDKFNKILNIIVDKIMLFDMMGLI